MTGASSAVVLRAGVIGAGTMGRMRAAAIARDAGMRLTGVCDVDVARAGDLAGRYNAASFADYRPLLDRPDIDLVIVSSPVHMHADMVLAALQAGKHVLCEKPLSSSSAACDRLVRAAAAAQRLLAVGFNHRYYPCFEFVKQTVDSGVLGPLDHIRVLAGHPGLREFREPWMYESATLGGGAMMDIGIHVTDLCRFIGGEIAEVYGVTSDRAWNVPGSEDNALAIFKTVAGIPISYQATWSEWKGYRLIVDVYGSRGMVRGYYAPMFNLLVTRSPDGGRIRRVHVHARKNLRERFLGWQRTAEEAIGRELADVRRALDGHQTPLATGLDGQRAVEVAEAVYASRTRNAPVTLASATAER